MITGFELATADGTVTVPIRLGRTAANGVTLLAGATGLTSVASTTVQLDEGAGTGGTYRGRRFTARHMTLPVRIDGDAAYVASTVVAINRILASGEARLRATTDTGTWVLNVALDGDVDSPWGVGTDRATVVRMTLPLVAAYPFWAGSTVTFTTEGTHTVATEAETTITVTVPGTLTSVTLTGPHGEAVAWTGSTSTGIVIDMNAGTVTTLTGAPLYSGLAANPDWWVLDDGATSFTVTVGGNSNPPSITVVPRKQVII